MATPTIVAGGTAVAQTEGASDDSGNNNHHILRAPKNPEIEKDCCPSSPTDLSFSSSSSRSICRCMVILCHHEAIICHHETITILTVARFLRPK
jgi:hypothetical protein